MAQVAVEDTRHKYEPHKHVSNVLWHFLGPKQFEKYNYEKAIERFDSYISPDSKFVTLKPFKGDGDFYKRKLTLHVTKAGISSLPSDDLIEYEVHEPKSVCFCDIPIGSLPTHIDKYGDIGIGIKRSTVLDVFQGKILPVRYYPNITNDSLEAFNKIHWELNEKKVELKNFIKIPTKIIPNLDFKSDDNIEEFGDIYEEREWRSMGQIDISVHDLSYVVIPDREYLKKSSRIKSLVENGVGLIVTKELYSVKGTGKAGGKSE